MKNTITYKDAGVDISLADESVKKIAQLAKSTFSSQVLHDIGLFGGFFKLDLNRFKNPVLVSSVDGVGTKLKIAFMTGIHDTIGEDLVNHCVNDIMTSGAEPLFFLDYVAFGKLDKFMLEKIIEGLARGCRNAQCALIGGETAEMPGFYQSDEYDISGTIVGAIDKDQVIDGSAIAIGDVLIGVPSSGLHTNGYSLARKILFDIEKINVTKYVDELNATLGEALLKVHKSYQAIILALKDKPYLHGMSHITGGGIVGNTVRVLPKQCALKIDWQAWEPLPIFRFIQSLGNVSPEEMRRVFNLGIGYIFIIDKNYVTQACEIIKQKNEQPIIMGEICVK